MIVKSIRDLLLTVVSSYVMMSIASAIVAYVVTKVFMKTSTVQITMLDVLREINTITRELVSGERSHTDVANWLLDFEKRLRAFTCDGCGDGSWGFENRFISGYGYVALRCCKRCGKAQEE
jgi:hypothetical protein